MSRTDTASITLNLSLPPEVIKAYFDGKAKVESAKHSSGSSSSFDWSSLLALTPLILPLLSNLSKSTESISSKMTECPSVTRKSQQTETDNSTCCDLEVKPEIVISFSQTPSESKVSKEKATLEESS